MCQKCESELPFANLHAHSCLSPFDGLGDPEAHMDFAYENGMNIHAFTEHGHMNSVPHAYLHQQRMEQDGKKMKYIKGMEAYFIEDLDKWHALRSDAKEKQNYQGDIEDEQDHTSGKDYIKRKKHLTLLAQNKIGLDNLYELTSKANSKRNYYRFPRLDWNLLEQHAAGLVVFSGCVGGVVADAYFAMPEGSTNNDIIANISSVLEQFKTIFGNRFFAELQWNGLDFQMAYNFYLIQAAKGLGIPLVSTVDCHYPRPDQWQAREIYKRLGWLGRNKKPEWFAKDLPKTIGEVPYELYPKNGDQVYNSYKMYTKLLNVEDKFDDALVVDSIKLAFEIGNSFIEDYDLDTEVQFPSFLIGDEDPDELLQSRAYEGLREKDLHNNKQYVQRLEQELSIINERGFSKYFLTMKAISDKAQEQMLSGPGRGSAAGALTSYVLNITQMDPIRFGLLFSRFMTRDQTSYPDIDFDVARREDFRDSLLRDWGNDCVVPITNFVLLKLRSVIKDVSKFYAIPFTETNRVTSVMMKEAEGPAKKDHGIKAGVYDPTFEEVKKYSSSLQAYFKKYPQVAKHVPVLLNQPRQLSCHAGGLVIGENLSQKMPLISVAQKEAQGRQAQTPWSEGQARRDLEPLGFLKYDILGVNTLEMIEHCIVHILQRHENIPEPSFEDVKEFYNKNLHPDILDFEDKHLNEWVFQQGNFLGTFQFTQPGAQNFCKAVSPSNILDVAATTSIFRPGPLGAGVSELYVNAKSSGRINYVHEIEEEFTKETYGQLIYQEQIAQLIHGFSIDISLDDGNKYRKILTKFRREIASDTLPDKQKKFIKQTESSFIGGCKLHGVSEIDALFLLEKMKKFAQYGFNKNHAVSYTAMSYQCAWLWTYYSIEWAAAFLEREPEGRKADAISSVQHQGFKIKETDINLSGRTWSIENDDTLVQPLTSLKGVGAAAVSEILKHRPFANIEDVLFRKGIDRRRINKRVLDALCRCGALNSFIDHRFTGDKHFWEACINHKPNTMAKLEKNLEQFVESGSWEKEEAVRNISTITGRYPVHLVLTKELKDRIDSMFVPPITHWEQHRPVVWFIPREVELKKTRHGKDYYVLKVIDSTNNTTSIKCWGIRADKDKVLTDRLYLAKIDYDVSWGYSIRNIWKKLKLVG